MPHQFDRSSESELSSENDYDFISNPSDDDSGQESVSFSDLSQDEDYDELVAAAPAVGAVLTGSIGSTVDLLPTPPNEEEEEQELPKDGGDDILNNTDLSTISLSNSNSTLRMPTVDSVIAGSGSGSGASSGSEQTTPPPAPLTVPPERYDIHFVNRYQPRATIEAIQHVEKSHIALVGFGINKLDTMRLVHKVGKLLVDSSVKYYYGSKNDKGFVFEEMKFDPGLGMVSVSICADMSLGELASSMSMSTMAIGYYSESYYDHELTHWFLDCDSFDNVPVLSFVGPEYDGTVVVRGCCPLLMDNNKRKTVPFDDKTVKYLKKHHVLELLASGEAGDPLKPVVVHHKSSGTYGNLLLSFGTLLAAFLMAMATVSLLFRSPASGPRPVAVSVDNSSSIDDGQVHSRGQGHPVAEDVPLSTSTHTHKVAGALITSEPQGLIDIRLMFGGGGGSVIYVTSYDSADSSDSSDWSDWSDSDTVAVTVPAPAPAPATSSPSSPTEASYASSLIPVGVEHKAPAAAAAAATTVWRQLRMDAIIDALVEYMYQLKREAVRIHGDLRQTEEWQRMKDLVDQSYKYIDIARGQSVLRLAEAQAWARSMSGQVQQWAEMKSNEAQLWANRLKDNSEHAYRMSKPYMDQAYEQLSSFENTIKQRSSEYYHKYESSIKRRSSEYYHKYKSAPSFRCHGCSMAKSRVAEAKKRVAEAHAHAKAQAYVHAQMFSEGCGSLRRRFEEKRAQIADTDKQIKAAKRQVKAAKKRARQMKAKHPNKWFAVYSR